MAHKWKDISNLLTEKRQCVKCQCIQTKVRDHLWMKVVKTYWFPKVGKCKNYV